MTGKDARKHNKANKRDYKNNLLPTDNKTPSNNSSDGSGSETESKNGPGKPGVASRPPGANNNKKPRIFDEQVHMDEVFAETPNTSDQFFDAENTLQVDANSGSTTAATAGIGTTTPGSTPADSTPRFLEPNKETVHSDGTSSNKETSAAPANSQPTAPNVSQHDKSF